MFSNIYRVFGGLMILTVLTFNSACFDKFKGTKANPNIPKTDTPFNKKGEKLEEKKGAEKKNNQTPIGNENNQERGNEGNNAEENNYVPANENVDEASFLVGVWRISYQLNGMQCMSESVFQPDGGYSSFSQCENGTYAIHLVGNWYMLEQGAVRIQYTDYSPKEYGGNPIRIPDGETIHFRVLDQNRIQTGAGIAYRVQ